MADNRHYVLICGNPLRDFEPVVALKGWRLVFPCGGIDMSSALVYHSDQPIACETAKTGYLHARTMFQFVVVATPHGGLPSQLLTPFPSPSGSVELFIVDEVIDPDGDDADFHHEHPLLLPEIASLVASFLYCPIFLLSFGATHPKIQSVVETLPRFVHFMTKACFCNSFSDVLRLYRSPFPIGQVYEFHKSSGDRDSTTDTTFTVTIRRADSIESASLCELTSSSFSPANASCFVFSEHCVVVDDPHGYANRHETTTEHTKEFRTLGCTFPLNALWREHGSVFVGGIVGRTQKREHQEEQEEEEEQKGQEPQEREGEEKTEKELEEAQMRRFWEEMRRREEARARRRAGLGGGTEEHPAVGPAVVFRLNLDAREMAQE